VRIETDFTQLVYSRISSFIGTLRRDHLEDNATVIIVTHGLALRLFLMRFFQWTVCV
jgi:broad specificity phosphatase PhoE